MSIEANASITVNGSIYEARPAENLLARLRLVGIPLPALCYHPAIKPIGSCRLCVVEIRERASAPALRLACSVRVREGLEITTQSAAIHNARQTALQKLLAMAPQSETLLRLAREFKLEPGRIPDGCIRCRLCVHVCRDVVGAHALAMEKREGQYFVIPLADKCIGCGTCANICPTHAISITDADNFRTISIRNEVIGQHALEKCEGCGKPFATPKFLAYTHHRTEPHPDVKEHHNYCPTCAKLFFRRVLPVSGLAPPDTMFHS